MGRGDLSNAVWELIGPPLPPRRGRWARPASDNRLFLNGMLHVLRVGCPGATCTSATANGTRSMSAIPCRAEQGVWDVLFSPSKVSSISPPPAYG